jgi:ribosome-associated protein
MKEKDIKEIYIRDENIKLGQLIKLAGMVDSGLEAKLEIVNEKVKLNGNIETQRGKKVIPGDVVEYKGEIIRVSKKEI